MAKPDRYRVNTGLHYRVRTGEKRAEVGDVVSDLPARAVGWLTDRGHITPVEAGADDEGAD